MTRREIFKTISDLLHWLIIRSVPPQDTGLIQHASWMYRSYRNPMGLTTGVGITNMILSSHCTCSVPFCKISVLGIIEFHLKRRSQYISDG